MNFDTMFRGMTLSGSGMNAERSRLDVIAKNIANANVTATPEGEPYRRQDVVFETVLDDAVDEDGLPGQVRVAETSTDFKSPLKEVYDPKHPMADGEGIVRMSNVNMAFEMVDLISASRAYEANLKAMTSYRDMMQQAMRLLET